MKKYIKPNCEPINVATEDTMQMSLRIFDNTGLIGNYDDYIITDGSEILTNHNRLWEENEEEWR